MVLKRRGFLKLLGIGTVSVAVTPSALHMAPTSQPLVTLATNEPSSCAWVDIVNVPNEFPPVLHPYFDELRMRNSNNAIEQLLSHTHIGRTT